MSILKERFAARIPHLRADLRELHDTYGSREIASVSVAQVLGGMRGIKGLLCDTSSVDPDRGLFIRDIPIADLRHASAEEIFYLLLLGDRPEAAAIEELRRDWKRRGEVPGYVWDVVAAMPRDSHPMVLLCVAILSMQRESHFAKAYAKGIPKTDHWIPMLEDALDLVARTPAVAAGIYRGLYGKGPRIAADPTTDHGGGFARLLGVADETGDFAQLIRMFLVLHSDHEGGNVSAHAATVVCSALSDLYQGITAGIEGLAGPLHGLANQECLDFVLAVRERFGGVPSEADLRAYCWETLNAGHVIPGYGHAVLRCPDPRFAALLEFGREKCTTSELFRIVERLHRIVPAVLEEQGKAKSPYPNVDACSGSLLYHFGITEIHFYTVLFAVSRIIGMAAQQVLARALGLPIERPKSVSTNWIRQAVSEAAATP